MNWLNGKLRSETNFNYLNSRVRKKKSYFKQTLIFVFCIFQLECLSKLGELDIPEIYGDPENVHQAKAHLVNSQEKHAHIRRLYTLLITQGVDILSAVQQPVSISRMIYEIKDKYERLLDSSG